MSIRVRRTEKSFLEVPQEESSRSSSTRSIIRHKTPNPFRVPEDNEFFAIREKKREDKELMQARMHSTRVESRTPTLGSRVAYRKMVQTQPEPFSQEEQALAQLILAPDSGQAQEGLRDFIKEKREIFLAQLAIDTKREELKRLEQLERDEEAAIKAKEAEITMFRDQFRSFLESDGKSTMESRRAAEEKMKQRLEVSLQIKKVSSEISNLNNEIAHFDEKLQECHSYQQFLESLTPPEWRKEHPLPELYFKDPQQLMILLHSLEEENMFLIHHCQEAEETVERYRYRFNEMLMERDGSISDMIGAKKKQEKVLETMKETNEANTVARDFHYGNEMSEAEYIGLIRAIGGFHEKLGFDATNSQDVQTMLTHIENILERMFAIMQTFEEEKLRALIQQKDRERRDQIRSAKNLQDKLEQEEKTQRAIKNAMMPIKRRTGRPLVERTMPKKRESREKREEAARKKLAQQQADEDLLYGEIWD